MKYHLIPLLFFFCFSAAGQFELTNIPFTVEGGQLSFPMTGGFTSPQFNNIDLDRDGVKDLVVFDRDGGLVKCFLINPATGSLEFAPEYEEMFPELNRWLIIRDYNGDGVEDLFTHSHIPGIPGVQVLRGAVDNGQWSFERVTWPNHRNIIEYKSNSGSFLNAYVSNIDHPAIDDVDGDGDLDLLSFEPGGSYIYYYKNTAVEEGYPLDSLNFVLEDRCWGKVFESEFSETLFLSDRPDRCADGSGNGGIQARHAGSAISLQDLDGDGLQDLLIGDLGSSQMTALYNGGTPENAFGVDQDSNYPSEDVPLDLQIFLNAYFVDIHGEGNESMIVSPNTQNAARNIDFVWRYDDGTPEASEFSASFVQENFLIDQTLDLNSTSVPAIADVNQDGLPDLVVGTYGRQTLPAEISPRLILFLNVGTPGSPEFELEDSDYLEMSQYSGSLYNSLAPAFGDLDSDGDIDLVLGSFSGELFYFENTAGPNQPFSFAQEISGFMDIDVGQFSIPQVVDVNGDGLQDLLVGERNGNSIGGSVCGNINYFENVGSSGAPEFGPDEQAPPNDPCFGEVFTRQPGDFTGYSSPQLLQLEQGNLLLSGSDKRGVLLYDANGEMGKFPLLEEPLGEINEGNRTHPRFFDLTGNGSFELILGNSRGGVQIYTTPYTTEGTVSTGGTPVGLELEIYPNPGKRNIQFRGMDADRIDMINLNGTVVHRWIKPESPLEVPPAIGAGMYFLRFGRAEGTIVKKYVLMED